MDQHQRHQKKVPFFFDSKSFKAVFLIFFFGCSSGPKKLDFEKSSLRDSREKELTQITSTGVNSQGAFSPKGDRIAYVSGKRNSHEFGQVYEVEVASRNERRITFNSGTDSFPHYHPKNESIMYSSTTDSLKENISLEQLKLSVGLPSAAATKTESDLPKSDIYISSLTGTSIRRLTSEKGFDGDAQFTPDGNKIIFSGENDKKITLKVFNLKKNNLEYINIPNKDLRWPSKQALQDTNLLVGVDYITSQMVVQDLKTNQIIFQTSDGAVYQQPSWHPNERKIVFSSNRKDKNNFDIFVFDLNQQCIQQVTYSLALDQDPVFSPDGKSILFTSNRSGVNQLFLISYDATQTCEKL